MKTIFRTSAAVLVALFSMSASAHGNGNGNGNGNGGNNGNGNGNGTPTTANNTTQLTVNVAELYSIIVDENATINLATQDDFMNGARSAATNMKVFASKGYKITAVASAEKFTSNKQGATDLPNVNNIDIIVSSPNAATERTTALNHTATEVFASDKGEKNTDFSVVYAIPAGNTEAFLTSGGQTLQTVVTYTITGK